MTKHQTKLIISLLVTLITIQCLFGALLLREQERTRKEAEAAQVSAEDNLRMQKEIRALMDPGREQAIDTEKERLRITAELDEAKARLAETQAALEHEGARLEKLQVGH